MQLDPSTVSPPIPSIPNSPSFQYPLSPQDFNYAKLYWPIKEGHYFLGYISRSVPNYPACLHRLPHESRISHNIRLLDYREQIDRCMPNAELHARSTMCAQIPDLMELERFIGELLSLNLIFFHLYNHYR